MSHIFLGHTNRHERLASQYDYTVYCGLTFAGHTNCGLGNKDKDRPREVWNQIYRQFLKEQCQSRTSVYYQTLLPCAETVCAGGRVLLLCWCFKELVLYVPRPLAVCHTELIAEKIIELAK